MVIESQEEIILLKSQKYEENKVDSESIRLELGALKENNCLFMFDES